MDDESKKLLLEIRDLQRQQLDLLQDATLPPWLRWRFSVRFLLIATGVVAVVLGLLTMSR